MLVHQCTELCSRLSHLRLCGGKLPSRDDIKEQLQLDQQQDEEGFYLGTWYELRQRTCPFCRLVASIVASSGSASGSTDLPDDQPIWLLLLPDAPVFRLGAPFLMAIKLVLMADSDGLVSCPDTARPVISPRISPGLMKNWLKTCEDHHDVCSHSKDDEAPSLPTHPVVAPRPPFDFDEEATSNFRLLDLKRRCLTKASLDSRYLALSYVWGQVPMFRLQEHNIEQLSAPGVLDEILPQLPQTIVDAMKLTEDLGESYLWVDALCLAQDSEHDMSRGIDLMNSIYEGSFVTIVAGDGEDAGAGLAGVGCDRSVGQSGVIARLGDLTWTSVQSIDRYLSRSVYSRRGWTLQEYVLPRRALIFINQSVYFRCKAANWAEDTWADIDLWHRDADDHNVVRVPHPLDGQLASLWAYQKVLEEYTCRQLRKDGDALRAVAGVTRPLFAGMCTKGLEGLPAYYLHHFLLFISAAGDLRRRPEFASFSWSGWEGKVKWPRENYFMPDQSGRPNFDPSHLLKNVRANHLLKLDKLSRKGNLEYLSTSSNKTDDPALTRFLKEMPAVFPENLIRRSLSRTTSPPFSGGSGCHADQPVWDEHFEDGVHRRATESKFHQKALDTANSQAEYDRLAAKITDTYAKLALMNWQAMRRWKVRGIRDSMQQSRFRGLGSVMAHSRFRRARLDAEEEANRLDNDGRVRMGRRFMEKLSKEKPETEFLPIPKFPPYSVLQFQSVTFRLRLGSTATSRERQAAIHNTASSAHDRVPGIPLYCRTGAPVIGSLHPDNLEATPEEGSEVEFIVIAKCQWPTAGSSIPHNSDDGPIDLLWVMAVEMIDGIAERRGIGQVYRSVLEDVQGPKPDLKWIFLG